MKIRSSCSTLKGLLNDAFFTVFLFVAAALASREAGAQTSPASDALEMTAAGTINWTSGEVFSTGIGAPPARAVNAAQARAMAERAAYVVAVRNLLETVKGVRVDATTMVENFMVKSDVIRTRVDGIVKGARIIKTSYQSDGSVEMLVGMPLKGALLDAIVPESFGRPAGMQAYPKPAAVPQKPLEQKKETPPSPAPVASKPATSARTTIPETLVTPAVPSGKKAEPTKSAVPENAPTLVFKGGVATGLILDGRGLGLRPALLPRIVDATGQEIYVGHIVTRTNAVEQGVAGYARDVDAASRNFRVTDNPAVIRGLRAAGTAKTDIVVGQADADVLRRLGNNADFLQYCRVIIVY